MGMRRTARGQQPRAVRSPVRLLTMHRLRVRLGFTVFDKTLAQYERAREAGIARLIRPAAVLSDYAGQRSSRMRRKCYGNGRRPAVLEELLPALKGEQWNPQGFAKLQRIRQLVPFGIDAHIDEEILFFRVLTENLPARERTAFLREIGMDREFTSQRQKLEHRAARVEKELASPAIRKPSQVYNILSEEPGEVAVFLAMRSDRRTSTGSGPQLPEPVSGCGCREIRLRRPGGPRLA